VCEREREREREIEMKDTDREEKRTVKEKRVRLAATRMKRRVFTVRTLCLRNTQI